MVVVHPVLAPVRPVLRRVLPVRVVRLAAARVEAPMGPRAVPAARAGVRMVARAPAVAPVAVAVAVAARRHACHDDTAPNAVVALWVSAVVRWQ
ncbi:MAG: hypothetical protein ACYDEV_01865 [Acidiferrobacter sp.]